jgi:hypothetical protein
VESSCERTLDSGRRKQIAAPAGWIGTGPERLSQGRIQRAVPTRQQTSPLPFPALCPGYEAESERRRGQARTPGRDERPHPGASGVDGNVPPLISGKAARCKFSPKNNERPELFRVQDARAALPQNCSSTKIKWGLASAYGTSGPSPPPKCHTPIRLDFRGFPTFFRARRKFSTVKSLWIPPMKTMSAECATYSYVCPERTRNLPQHSGELADRHVRDRHAKDRVLERRSGTHHRAFAA